MTPTTPLPRDAMPTLHLLLEREEALRDTALRRLQQAEDDARRAQSQAEMLAGYRDEYRARWGAQFAQGASVSVVQCYRGFMTRLDDAIAQQQRHAAQAAAHAGQCRDELAARQVRVASVRRLIERRAHEQRRGAVRREQKAGDEAAARLQRAAAPWPAVAVGGGA